MDSFHNCSQCPVNFCLADNGISVLKKSKVDFFYTPIKESRFSTVKKDDRADLGWEIQQLEKHDLSPRKKMNLGKKN